MAGWFEDEKMWTPLDPVIITVEMVGGPRDGEITTMKIEGPEANETIHIEWATGKTVHVYNTREEHVIGARNETMKAYYDGAFPILRGH